MDKRLILAVAGSGKTTYIIDKLDLEKRFLIITYTNNNESNLRNAINNKFGYFPNNITLFSYFTFLYSFCFRPLLAYKYEIKGVFWNRPPDFTLKLLRTNYKFHFSTDNRIYYNRIAHLCLTISKDITARIEKYFDCLMIDEVQDFAGHDFNLLKEITKGKNDCLFVGDFYQHTFDTSNDGNINKNLYEDYSKYLIVFKENNLNIDTDTLGKSYRCSSDICEFIRKKLGVKIYNHTNKEGEIVNLTKDDYIKSIVENDNIIKLFYQNSSKYKCYSMNWGVSKGINEFIDVCVVLNANTLRHFNKNTLSNLPNSTINKLYVACTRANRHLYFADEKKLGNYKK